MATIGETKELLSNTGLLGQIPDDILGELAVEMEQVSVEADETIVRKGDPGDSMYIIVKGQVRVHDGELAFNRLGPGDVFGEMAALTPEARSASVTAEVDTDLLRLDHQAFYDLMAGRVEVVRGVIQVLSRRLRGRTEDLVQDIMRRKTLEHELEIGRSIQAGFLPADLPRVPGWEIAAHLQAARHVGGDFYDAFQLSGTKRIALVVGDVSDKGVGAALFMTLFRSLIRVTCTWSFTIGANNSVPSPTEPPDTSEILRTSLTVTNDYVERNHGETNMFATVFFALLDPVTGSLAYVNGGHEPPIVLSCTGKTEHLQPTGPAVGVIPGVHFEIGHAHLAAGDTLFAFTDGVTEAMSRTGELFSEERLLSMLVERTGLTATALLSHVTTCLKHHSAGVDQYDDITMLAVRRMPAG